MSNVCFAAVADVQRTDIDGRSGRVAPPTREAEFGQQQTLCSEDEGLNALYVERPLTSDANDRFGQERLSGKGRQHSFAGRDSGLPESPVTAC